MKIRELYFDDIYLMSEIIDKMDLQSDINKLFDDAKKQPDPQAYAGGQMLMLIFKRLHKVKNEVTLFVANITEQSVEDMQKLKLSEIKNILMDLFKDEEFQAFFKRV